MTHPDKEAAQKDQDRDNRRAVLVASLTFAQTRHLGAISLVELTEMLGLDSELTELAGDPDTAPDRHRRIEDARRAVGLTVDELADREQPSA